MSPLALKVLLHYYVTPAQFDKNKAHNLELDAIAQFIRDGLLQERQKGRDGDDSYEITQRGKAYCYAALNLPLPEIRWEMPGFMVCMCRESRWPSPVGLCGTCPHEKVTRYADDFKWPLK